ncbi:MAG: DUF1826 domain-containing protein [Bacteroidota bacterium]
MTILDTLAFMRSGLRKPRQVMSGSWEERQAIVTEDVNLFCWNRPAYPTITTYLEKMLARPTRPITSHVQLETLDASISSAKSEWNLNNDDGCDIFWEDVARLTRDFLSFANDRSGTIHLKVIDNDSCTKFHTDGYTLRLFTTYYGKGTEWLPEQAVNRSGLGKSNELIVKDPKQVKRMDAFEVGILKGEVPKRNSGVKGIVHRSPSISHLGEKRIIFRIDI